MQPLLRGGAMARSQRTNKHIEKGRWAGVSSANQPAELCAHVTGIWHFSGYFAETGIGRLYMLGMFC